jgi:hypothetical protein
MTNKWIILTNTICQGDIPAWFDDTDRPVLFDTEKEAAEEMLSEHIDKLEHQLEELKTGVRQRDEVDWHCEDWIEACTLDDNGTISTERNDSLYNPKTYVR